MNLATAVLGACIADYHSGPISRGQLQRYAEASGDSNPLHLDPAFARKAGFPDVIVHGMLAMALLGRLLTDHFDAKSLRKFDARFVATLDVDQSLHCRACLAARSNGLVTLDLDAYDDRGALIVTGCAEVVVAR